LSRPIMLRSRRESHHRNGITDLNPLQQTSATKSALFGPHAMSDLSPECASKRTCADHSEFMGSRPKSQVPALVRVVKRAPSDNCLAPWRPMNALISV
jgi:hypothetical protein